MRSVKIDLLRFIGLSMIILAHVHPGAIVFQLRNFDVPLMVIVSGMAFAVSFNESEKYSEYIWKRVKRLVLPVWAFLSIYFPLVFIFRPSSSDVGSLNVILGSYFMINGIGFVWIIRVFILVALVAPFIYGLHKKNTSDFKFLFTVILSLFVFELFRYIFSLHSEDSSLTYLSAEYSLFYLVPYSLLFALGLRIPKLGREVNYALSFFFLAIFVSIAVTLYIHTGEFVSTNDYKYPPSIYYTSYAISVSIFIWLISDRIQHLLSRVKLLEKFVLHIARNTIWIYLWHIPMVKVLDKLVPNMNILLKYVIVSSFGITVASCQIWILTRFLIPRIKSVKLAKNLRVVFTG